MIKNLRSLAILAAVIKEGSFRAAGKALDLSPSVISHHIAKLENSLDCTIFIRTSRKLQLTPRGSILHAAAREMVDAVGEGLQAISEPEHQASESLGVCTPRGVAPEMLLRVTEDFLRACPHVNLTLSFPQEGRDPFEDNIDLAILPERPDNDALAYRHLFDKAMGFYAAPDLVRKINQMAVCDLPQLAPIILAPGFSKSDWQMAFTDLIGPNVPALEFRLTCDEIDTAHQLAIAGMGIAVLSNFRADKDLKSGSLMPILQEFSLPSCPYFAVWRRNAGKRSLTLKFLEHILRELDTKPASEQVLVSV